MRRPAVSPRSCRPTSRRLSRSSRGEDAAVPFPNQALGAILCLGVLALARPATAVAAATADAAPEIVGVRVGFDGHYKVGLWTPVEVTLRGGDRVLSGRLSLAVPDGEGVPSRVSTPPGEPCRVEPGRKTSARLYVRFGRVNSSMRAEFEVDGRVVAERIFETAERAGATHYLPAIEQGGLMLVVAPQPMGVEQAAVMQGAGGGQAARVVRLETIEQLPDRWYGYEGVDAVALSTSRPEIYRSLDADGPRVRALDTWVRMGGKLLLSAGAEAEKALGPGAPLAGFAPGRLEEVIPLRQSGALETYCRSSVPVPAPAGGAPFALPAARLSDPAGVVEASDGDLPLVVRAPHGFGQVVFVAVDLDRPPLGDWSELGKLVVRLLDLGQAAGDENEEGAAMMHYGFTDMAGQLRSALDRFPGVPVVPFAWVAGLIVAYIVLIGPVDYFLLRRLGGRMHWTWVTFPLVVVGTCVAACVAARELKGRDVRIHTAEVIDFDAASGLVRGTAWANLFSPRTAAYDLAFRPALPRQQGDAAGDVTVSWLGLPGPALGGMASPSTDPLLPGEHYDFAPAVDAIDGVPVQVWSTRSFTARWSGTAAGVPRADLTARADLPEGTVTNTLAFPLSDCLLVYGTWAYELGTLQPGASTEVGPSVPRTELKTLLTGRRIVFDDPKQEKSHSESTPYDPSSVDLTYILRMMTFFQATGGARYTGLANQYQGFIDLSGSLGAGRAVLFGRGPSGRATAGGQAAAGSLSEAGAGGPLGAGTWLDGGRPIAGPADPQTTIYRFVLPVERQ